jgi:hypothetical protein
MSPIYDPNPSNPVQLKYCDWYLEESKKCEETLSHMRNILGTFAIETNTTYHKLEGYLMGVRAMYRKFEEIPK